MDFQQSIQNSLKSSVTRWSQLSCCSWKFKFCEKLQFYQTFDAAPSSSTIFWILLKIKLSYCADHNLSDINPTWQYLIILYCSLTWIKLIWRMVREKFYIVNIIAAFKLYSSFLINDFFSLALFSSMNLSILMLIKSNWDWKFAKVVLWQFMFQWFEN